MHHSDTAHLESAQKILCKSPPWLICSKITLKACEPRMTVLSPFTAHWYGNHLGKFLGAARAHGEGTRGKRESTVSDRGGAERFLKGVPVQAIDLRQIEPHIKFA